MNNKAIIKIVVWSVVAIALTVMMIMFMNKKIEFNGFSFGSWNYYSDEEKYTIGAGSIKAEALKNIKINWMAGAVNVISYDGSEIVIEEDAEFDEDKQLRYLYEDDNLTIQYCKSSKKIGLNFGSDNSNNKKLTVKIPAKLTEKIKECKISTVSARQDIRNITCDDINIDTVSGEIKLNSIDTNSVDIDGTSGAVDISKGKIEKLNIDTISGSVSFEGRVDKIDMDTTSGELKVDSEICPSKIDFSGISADCTLNIPQGDGFTAEFDTVSGDFNSDFAVKNKGDKHICGDAKGEYDFDTTSGDVTINEK